MLTMIGYTRVSTRNQGDNGISLNGQRQQIREWATRNNVRIGKWYTDAASARGEENLSDRKGFNEAVGLALEKGWPIVAATADRFSRSVPSYDRFVEAGGKLYSTDVGFRDDDAEMRGRIARAQHDGDKISRRTREGQKRAKANGKVFGNPQIDKARENAREVQRKNKRSNHDEFRNELARVEAAGAKTDSEVANAFNESSYVTARGKAWTLFNVARMRRESRIDEQQLKIPAAALKVEADPLFTDDCCLTEGGCRKLLNALAVLGEGKEFIDKAAQLKGRVLPDTGMRKIKELIERARGETDPLFTRDRRLTEGGLQRFLRALAVLEKSQHQLDRMAKLKGLTLTDAAIAKIKDKCKQAYEKKLANEKELEEEELEEVAAYEMRSRRWGSYCDVRAARQ